MELTTTPTNTGIILAEAIKLDVHPAAVYLAGLAPSGRTTQEQALNYIAGLLRGGIDKNWNITDEPLLDWFPVNWAALRFQHTAYIRSRLQERYQPRTVNKMLCALRGVLKAAWKLGQVPTDDYLKAAAVESVKVDTPPAGRDIPDREVAALFAICNADDTPAGCRDAAIIGILHTCGVRREELVKLDIQDYNPMAEELTVHGKRNKTRTVYVVNGTADALKDWLAIRGAAAGALFHPLHKSGSIIRRPMTPQAVYNVIKSRAEQAGIANIHPHDFRRTAIGNWLDLGVDVVTVSKIVGHESIVTTGKYDRRPEQAKLKAAQLLTVPYTPRSK